MKAIDLNGRWKFKAINKYKLALSANLVVSRWMDATVPGTVHTDLLAHNIIPDPFYRMNELDVQWVDSLQWVYRREFHVPEKFLNEDRIYLVAEGLDTYAQIRLNGKLIATTANMFVEHEFEVKRYLKPGRNYIEILFDSPTLRSKALEKKYGRLQVSADPHRVYVRKAQYSFGWDWGPKLTTSGIWRNIALKAFSHGRLQDSFVKIILVSKQEALVELSVDVERHDKQPLTLRTFVAGFTSSMEYETQVTSRRVKFRIRIPHPQLWWPNGYGDQPMYAAVFSLMHDGKEIHQVEVPFAIRTIRLLQEKDHEGSSFIFEINGLKIFCKGADWIPCDNFIPRISDTTYEALLRMAKDAYTNMVRVWGGGIYEQEIFYDLCDRLGLMVWQDFMYACGEYPEEPWFLREAKREAGKVTKRLRNHPCIVLWCGNNECESFFCTENAGQAPDDMNGSRIFRDILPQVCKQLDGTRPYWRSSPFGKGFPNAESNGNHHQWMVWSCWKDYKEYAKDNARFVTEFGFQAPANRRTFKEVTLPSDRHPQSRVMEHHNKQVEGTERLIRFQAAHYLLGKSFDEFIYKGQLVQAEALKFAVEHWRRRKFKTAGSLFWQLNDCWPVSSWSVVDSALRPKAAYYFAKQFFAPVLVSFKQTANNIEVWITNDVLKTMKGTLVVMLRSFPGKKIWTKKMVIEISPNSSHVAYRIQSDSYNGFDPSAHYLHVQLWVNGSPTSGNRFFFVEPKYLQLSKPHVRMKLSSEQKHRYLLTLKATTFVKNVFIEIDREDVFFEDNYFDIDAGGSKEIRFVSTRTLSFLRRDIKLRWL